MQRVVAVLLFASFVRVLGPSGQERRLSVELLQVQFCDEGLTQLLERLHPIGNQDVLWCAYFNQLKATFSDEQSLSFDYFLSYIDAFCLFLLCSMQNHYLKDSPAAYMIVIDLVERLGQDIFQFSPLFDTQSKKKIALAIKKTFLDYIFRQCKQLYDHLAESFLEQCDIYTTVYSDILFAERLLDILYFTIKCYCFGGKKIAWAQGKLTELLHSVGYNIEQFAHIDFARPEGVVWMHLALITRIISEPMYCYTHPIVLPVIRIFFRELVQALFSNEIDFSLAQVTECKKKVAAAAKNLLQIKVARCKGLNSEEANSYQLHLKLERSARRQRNIILAIIEQFDSLLLLYNGSEKTQEELLDMWDQEFFDGKVDRQPFRATI